MLLHHLWRVCIRFRPDWKRLEIAPAILLVTPNFDDNQLDLEKVCCFLINCLL